MGKSNRNQKVNRVTLLFDTFLTESQNLYNSFVVSNIPCNVVVINDDGFLPDGVDSLYEYFLGGFDTTSKPLYFNEVKVPEFWEISSTNNSGQVHDLNKLRARIFYANPTNTRLVRCVEWLDESGVVRFCDYYNRYGKLYARGTFDKNQKLILKSYFDSKNREVIVEDYVTNDIILNNDDKVMIFSSKVEFVTYYLKLRELDKTRIFINSLGTPFFVSNKLSSDDIKNKDDVLFWQEGKRGDVPGNMQYIIDGNASRIGRVYVQKKDSYDALLKLGVPTNIVKCLGYVYPFIRNSRHKKRALIMTNSDRIEHLDKLVEGLSDVHFHIAAITEMSAKLSSFGKYDNVTLYPAVRMDMIDTLFDKCDIYLDINRENEIVNAINTAFLNNQLIFAFGETIHNANYIASDNRYKASDYKGLIKALEEICNYTNKWDDRLNTQRTHALSESPTTYADL